MWPVYSAARPVKIASILCLTLCNTSAQGSVRESYFCDSEALTYEQGIGRIRWAWACGLEYCIDRSADSWSPQQAMAACGYPVFDKITPVSATFERASGQYLCRLDGDLQTQALATDEDSLRGWLSDLVLESRCRPIEARGP